MSGQMSTDMKRAVDQCEAAAQMCEQLLPRCMEVGGEQMMRAGTKLMSCMDMCHMAANMMTRCAGSKASTEMPNMCMRSLELCADMCDLCVRMARSMEGAEWVECADVMARCAEACRQMGPQVMQPA